MMVPTTGYFDFNVFATDEPDRVSLVDVGGGIGNKLKEILAKNPRLEPERCVLQDQEKTIAMSEQEKIVPGARLMVHDFWQKQPVKSESLISPLKFVVLMSWSRREGILHPTRLA